MRFLTRAAPLVLALASAAASADAQNRTPQDRNLLTLEDIRAAPPSSVHQLIRAKRPRWLTIRGHSTLRTVPGRDIMGRPTVFMEPAQIIVYMDGVRFGSQDALKSINTDDVASIEYLDAQSATQAYGSNHQYGAIIVRRRVR